MNDASGASADDREDADPDPGGEASTAGHPAEAAAPTPDDEDRAAAEAEAEALEQEAALRQRRAVLFVAAMAIVLPLGAAGGISLPILVVAVLGTLFLAWLFA